MFIDGDTNSAVNAGVIRFVEEMADGVIDTSAAIEGSYNGEYSLTNGMKLTWSDEFNGTALDSDTWSHTKMKDNSVNTVNGGVQIYSNSANNNRVENGELIINAGLSGDDVDCFIMDSRASASPMYFQYGYMEGRIKMNSVEGFGTSLWTTSKDSTQGSEFDLFENGGSTNRFRPNIHVWAYGHLELLQGENGDKPAYELKNGKFADEYHNFAIDWSDDTINYYIDGKLLYSFDCTADERYHILDKISNVCFQIAGGSMSWPTASSDEAKADWIRVWQKEGQIIEQ